MRTLLRNRRCLNKLSTRLWRIHDLDRGLDEILMGAVELLGADFGNVQLYDSRARVLRIAVHRSFDRRFLEHFREVSTIDNAACGRALRAGRRTIIEDVTKDPGFAPHRAIARHSGFRAVQSTPLVARDGSPLGMLSTHFRSPHRPNAFDLEQVDLYARQAAIFIERCRLERAAQDGESNLRLSLEAAGAGTWAWDGKTGEVSWDDRFHGLYGLKRRHRRDFRTWLGRIHQDDRKRLLAAIADMRQHRTRRNWDIEFRSVRPNGTVIWHHGLGQAIRDPRGRLLGLRGLDTDITERRLDRKALEESEFRLREAQRVARIGSWEWDLLTDQTWWDPEIYAMHGMSKRAKPFTPADLLQRVHPEDRTRLQTAIAAAVSAGRAADLEYRSKHADGSIRFIHAVGAVVQSDPRGRPLKMVGINHDVTTQRETEHARRLSEERFRAIFEHGPMGVALGDLTGRMILANPAFHRMLAYEDGALIGRNFRQLTAGPDLVQENRLIGELLAGKRSGYTIEKRYRRRDRRLLWVKVTTSLLRDSKGAPEFGLAIVEDISERKRAERLLRDREDRLRRANAELLEANHRLRALLDTTLVGIATLDHRGRVRTANRGLEAMLGHAPGELAGRGFASLVDSSGRPERAIPRGGQRPDAEPDTTLGHEAFARRINGEVFAVEMDRAPFRVGGRRSEVVVLRDVSERRRLETEVTLAAERAQHHLAADIHDGLGQHLHAMKYLAEEQHRRLLRAGSTEAPGMRRQIELIDAGIAQARRIARGLRPVEDLPDGLMLGLRRLAAELDALGPVEVRFRCPRKVEVHDNLVASHLFRIAQEAVSNALRHGGCRRITLRLTGTTMRVRILVEDDGRGLARDRPSGMGMKLMRYRANAIAGTLIVGNAARRGTQVTCTVSRIVPSPVVHAGG